ncbi:MAG: biopolymer transporter ExbD [Steroidobacteraceae bacterium]
MKNSTLARRQQRNHARYRGRNDLNIVPMLDVMTILTFFLIFSAVFSKTSVLELDLPGPGARADSTPPALQLEVIVRRTGIEVADRGTGVLAAVPLTERGNQDVVRLSAVLAEIKGRYPTVDGATMLVDENVDYDTIVQVMDAVRARQQVDGPHVTSTPLFPRISLGDAPT